MQTRVATAETGLATTAVPEGAPALPPRISWGAVLAGGLVAVTVGAMLNVLGLAIGATTIDPATPGDTPSASLLGMAGGIWLLVANLIGLAVGGWVAARLSGTSDDTDGVLHGLSVWAIGFLVSAVLLGQAVAGVTGTATRGAASIIGGTVQGAGQAIGQAAQAVAPSVGAVDPNALVERLQRGLQTGGDPAAMSPDQRRAEIAQLLGDRVRQGEFRGGARERLSQLVAAEAGIPADEANNRITQLETQARETAAQAEAQARRAAEAASNAAATGAYWLFAAMILGAVAAVFGARIGTRRAVPTTAYAYN
jgi:predicted nucleic acid-binding protein